MTSPAHPGRSKHRKSILLDTRNNNVKHKDLHPNVYRPLFHIFWPIILVGFPNIILLLLHIPFFYLFSNLIYIPMTTFIILMFNIWKTYQASCVHLIKRVDGLDHIFHSKYDTIKDEPFYHDVGYLRKAYILSPFRQTLLYYAYKQHIISPEEYKIANNQIISHQQQLHALHNKDEDKSNQEKTTLCQNFTHIASSGLLSETKLLSFEKDITPHTTGLIFHQTVEGFCASATFSTLLLSLPNVPLFPMTQLPQPLSLDKTSQFFSKYIDIELCEDHGIHSHSSASNMSKNDETGGQIDKGLFSLGNANKDGSYLSSNRFHKCTKMESPIIGLHTYHVDQKVLSFGSFQNIIVQANLNDQRVCVNFLRTPLFNPKTRQKHWGTAAGHWSPIASVIYISSQEKEQHRQTYPQRYTLNHNWNKDGEFYALVLDVNHIYGAFLVPLYELYLACYSRDESGYRGFLLFDINPKTIACME